ncbi:hypothetical protein HG535_0E03360 [Zygotorulaspora mrakii]|uniref:Mitochondrial acidic protein MAM33 n=1 Tax=Zygotorulaspora mrakii TaxID=42260 RepID=A0A7H9B628_ZYGMR|nr:uncharacterized protein HG535_0E03360 [Zygotorulaspora mrakii]QLG73252.1 hypothetical protein HG535_0E03360 [Zygotorulaspora mrakii]
MSLRLITQVVLRNVSGVQRLAKVSRSIGSTSYTPKIMMSASQSRLLSSCASVRNQQTDNVSAILKSEIKVESDTATETSVQSFQPFLDKFGFSIVDTNGRNLAQIVKKTDDETVHVFFDVAQVANLPYDSAVTETATSADGEAVNEDDYDSLSDNFANVNSVVVRHSDNSAVSFELLMNLQEGSFYIDSVTPFESAEKALSESAEAEVQRELVYHGPPFSNLDEELQEALESYLSSRGVNEELSSFIAAFSEFKENDEYIKWLKSMKTFFS